MAPKVFDLDGTLIDTYTAHLMAYRAVGVEPPAGFNTMPARLWLTDRAKHAAKQAVFPRYLIEYGRPLPLLQYHDGNIHAILTGASDRTVSACLEVFPDLLGVPIYHGLSSDDKLAWLKRQPEPGWYYDNDCALQSRVLFETAWMPVYVR